MQETRGEWGAAAPLGTPPPVVHPRSSRTAPPPGGRCDGFSRRVATGGGVAATGAADDSAADADEAAGAHILDGDAAIASTRRGARTRPPAGGTASAPSVAEEADQNGDGSEGPAAPSEVTGARPLQAWMPKVFVQDYMLDTLVCCVLQTCALPLLQPIGTRPSLVFAVVIGDKKSHSCAIVMRWGGGKTNMCIMWVSSRGGFLCSCFRGTRNAMSLSATSRSTSCSHVALLKQAVEAAGVSANTFQSRMCLRADAADSAFNDVYGSTVVWPVLHRSVFSLVTFSAANAAAFVAPGCRRFRSRCGHVRVAREHLGSDGRTMADVGSSPAAVAARSASRKAPTRLRVLDNEEEDEGVEKQPLHTMRGRTDSDDSENAFTLRRQDVVKLGTAVIRTFNVPSETACCTICGHNPTFIDIDAQLLGCTDPDNVPSVRPALKSPVLDIPSHKLCIVEKAPLRAAIEKVRRTAAPLTAPQVGLLQDWHATISAHGRPSPQAAAAAIFCGSFHSGRRSYLRIRPTLVVDRLAAMMRRWHGPVQLIRATTQRPQGQAAKADAGGRPPPRQRRQHDAGWGGRARQACGRHVA
ncbi:hypothetical protein BU14_0085s0009 [Porphyra umbilicalis]|uniref:Uncharacterized protein n=1 Tax=Porphyra umbilicalis TaxID=2786 RepID=A0A1X6PE81_PORUM|nr:hypothetical protein BU14_0085s0009 [Porphyra umbilicalis]|eukprot:OSX79158.1 hypothetical protein BU14_0085s0009 [Porphyra umbilicalis]